MNKICNIYNYPSHYRHSIYSLLDSTYNCTFLFGDEDLKIKRFDLNILKDAYYIHVYKLWRLAFQPQIIPFLFKDYDIYIMTAATNDISHWLFLLLSRFFKRKKVYIWGHGVYGYETKARLFIRKLFYGLADGLFIYGDYARQNILKLGYNSARVFLIHNSLDYDIQLSIRKKMGNDSIYRTHFSNDHRVLIFIGRLTKVKRLDLILDAVAILREEKEIYNVVFVGNGEEKDTLNEKAALLGLDHNVWFYGECYNEEENARLIYNADLCVAPGNVGLTSVHSLMFGTPVISHNDFTWQMPEFEVIKEWKTGCFFERNNSESLARSISKWFSQNGNNREKVRNNCYEIIDQEWNPYYQINVFKKAFDV